MAVTSLKQFFWEILVAPVLRRRSLVVRIVSALVLMNAAYALLLLLVNGFLAAFFADPNVAFVKVGELVPKKLQFLTSDWVPLTIERSTLAWIVPVGIVIAGVLKALSTYWYNFSQEELALSVAREYRERMFAAILRLPWMSSAKRNSGEWMSVIMADAVFLQSRLSDLLTGFVKDALLLLTGIISLAWFYWPAALLLLGIAPFIGWSMGRAGKRIAYFAQAFQHELGVLAGLVLDLRSRFGFMKAQHAEQFEARIFSDANDRYLKMMTGSIFIRALITPAMEWVGMLVFAGFFLLWTKGKLPGDITPIIAVQFFATLGAVLRPTREIGEQIARWGETIGGLRRSMNVFIEVEQAAGPLGQLPDATIEMRMQPLFEVKHLELKYGEQTRFTADDLVIASGKAIAIVGASGAGKSTFLKSLGGLIEPHAWQASHAWREVTAHCALVSQQPFLFQETVKNNLLYGLDHVVLQSTTDEMLYAAMRIVNLEDAVKSLSNGLETIFNPVAHNFSGGQIQRLVVARALLRRKPILLLDEAMAAVDGATEKDMTERLIDTVHHTGTVLISVTHRLQWLSLYDEVWFVEAGRIIARGHHDHLMTSNIRYSAFVRAETMAGGT